MKIHTPKDRASLRILGVALIAFAFSFDAGVIGAAIAFSALITGARILYLLEMGQNR